ncbi:Protein of unknown function [Desulfacinum hydrothermale DSM 13146]|uniref:Uncharacterized protein n=1 Tax=Desulfacinum hydrothermale DSM 13146 TaxID=1121390 RepID=A0A1W1XRP9_9BACT|nr:coiled-coil domain-containing protein [Desulfacinum hydrothermale]SMC26532.1 Protein of unknown function [Desulfacinum hydrothermale DSM 13146]
MKHLVLLIFFCCTLLATPARAVETAPRISDREIVERLAKLEEGQRSLEKRIDDLDTRLNKRIDDLDAKLTGRIKELDAKSNGRIDDLDAKLNKRIDDLDAKLNKRIDDLRSEMNARFEAVQARFDTLQWMFGLFITISLVILGFVLRMQWQMNRRLTRLEAIQEKQGQDLEFLKSLLEKLLPPKGVL